MQRADGRSSLEMRKIEIELGVVPRADGSAKVSFGDTVALASCYGPKTLLPKHEQELQGVLRCRYSMAPFSTEERRSPGPDRRSVEISKVMRSALEPAIFLEEFPRAVIDVFVEILNADGSTRVTGINAASLALACAGVPMRGLVSAVSVGKVDGKLVVDLTGKEDQESEADISLALLPASDEITLLQMDGRLSKQELLELLRIGRENCLKIEEQQRKVLRRMYEE